jgi:hypothetical protein
MVGKSSPKAVQSTKRGLSLAMETGNIEEAVVNHAVSPESVRHFDGKNIKVSECPRKSEGSIVMLTFSLTNRALRTYTKEGLRSFSEVCTSTVWKVNSQQFFPETEANLGQSCKIVIRTRNYSKSLELMKKGISKGCI